MMTSSSETCELRGDLICGLCARTAASVQGPRTPRFVPRTVRIAAAEHAGPVRRLRCPHCGGHLTLQDVQEVRTYAPPVRWDDGQDDEQGWLAARRRRRFAGW